MLATFNTSYNKFVIFGLAALVVLGNAMAGQDLGLSAHQQNWVNVLVTAAGAALGLATGNKNQPTLLPDHVVVNKRDVKEGAAILVAHKP